MPSAKYRLWERRSAAPSVGNGCWKIPKSPKSREKRARYVLHGSINHPFLRMCRCCFLEWIPADSRTVVQQLLWSPMTMECFLISSLGTKSSSRFPMVNRYLLVYSKISFQGNIGNSKFLTAFDYLYLI